MRRQVARVRRFLVALMRGKPDLSEQNEELLAGVWAQERFERTHPRTCVASRQAARTADTERVRPWGR
jgi:hypothetical protein